MLTPAHVASSYLLSQIPRLFGQPLSTDEVATVILAGNIIDLDFLFGYLRNKKGDDHHNFLTHTPLFVFIVWIMGFLLFSSTFSFLAWVLILGSGLLHLVLDDTGYWFCKLGWQEISKYPQINWLYPLAPFKSRKYHGTNRSLLKDYFQKARVNVFLEVTLIFSAIVVFLTIR